MQIGFWQDVSPQSNKTGLYTQLPHGGGWYMQLDYGRQADMDELYEAYEKESSPYKREQIEKSMNKILSESGATRQLRDELIRATRVNDKSRVEYLRIELRRVEAEKYNNNIQL